MKYIFLAVFALMMGVAPANALNGNPPYYWLMYGNG
jgi:hypothetical protein